MNKQELLKQVTELKELKAMAEELQDEITAQNASELKVGIFKIRFVDVTTSRFDTSAFKAIYKDLYNQFTKQIQSKRFSVA